MNPNQGYAGTQAGQTLAKVDREPTINERLNRIAEHLQGQCDRIESVLARVNGTPQTPERSLNAPTPIHSTLPLATVVEHLEAVQSRLVGLASNVERIA